MSDGKKKTLSLGGGRLELGKKVDVGEGRSRGKSGLQVEVKRKRGASTGGGQQPQQQPKQQQQRPAEKKKSQDDKPRRDRDRNRNRGGGGNRGAQDNRGGNRRLTSEELANRQRVLANAREMDEQRRQEAEAEEKRRAEKRAREAEARKKAEEEAAAQAAEEEARAAAEEAARKREEDAARKAAAEKRESGESYAPRPEKKEKKAERPGRPAPGQPVNTRALIERETEQRDRRGAKGKVAAKKGPAGAGRGGDQRRRGGRIDVDRLIENGGEERQRSLASIKRKRERERRAHQQSLQEKKKIVRDVVVPEAITVGELANRMAERTADVVKSLMKMGVMATQNQTIDQDTAELIIEEFGHNMTRVAESDVEDALKRPEDSEDSKQPRPPVVTIMGHVDHGKTSLLDALRNANVVAGEAGGITQHIGAYQILDPNENRITFLDTPGHAAFTAMRARGAQVTDIVILVVAADDSIMPQTIEAIAHSKAAGVPMIVAINKMDKPGADANKVRTELLQHEVIVEQFQGDTQDVEISAKTGDGLDKLIEALSLQAELLELKANPDREAEGVVVEAKLDKGRGPVATVLVQGGTLRQGDIFVAGTAWGRVRAMINDKGEQIKEADPSMPVEVLGLQSTPNAGDEFAVVESEAKAREVVEFRERKEKADRAAKGAATSMDMLFSKIKEGKVEELPVVVKADVQGSVEAINGALEKMGNDEVKVRILHSAVGGITESDVQLAGASNAVILAFNVRANSQARDLAKRDGVTINQYSIIYDLTEDIKAALSGMLSPVLKEHYLGTAEILQVFRISKVGNVAGCRVEDGVVRRGAGVRLIRDNVVIHQGTLKTLKRHQDEVKEVKMGTECGMAFENYENIKAGDRIEAYEVEEVAREIE